MLDSCEREGNSDRKMLRGDDVHCASVQFMSDDGPVSDQVDDNIAVPGCSPLRRDVGDKEDSLHKHMMNMNKYDEAILSCEAQLPLRSS